MDEKHKHGLKYSTFEGAVKISLNLGTKIKGTTYIWGPKNCNLPNFHFRLFVLDECEVISTNTSFGVLYLHQTLDTSGTLLHASSSHVFFNYLNVGCHWDMIIRWIEHTFRKQREHALNSNRYEFVLLSIITFNLIYIYIYIFNIIWKINV